jgi:ribbon-helix-helix CopG family protein
MPTSRRTTILADPDILERVDRLARRERTTKTAVIGAALEAWLEIHERPTTLPFVGIGRSGHGRLSLDGRSIARREMGRREADPRPARPTRPVRRPTPGS